MSPRQKEGFKLFTSAVAIICILYASSCWYSVSPHGSDLPLEITFWFLGFLCVAMLYFFIGTAWDLIGIFLRLGSYTWAERKSDLKITTVLSMITLISTFTAIRFGDYLKNRGLRSMAVQAKPLIEAIQSYQIANKVPPHTSEDVVPTYIISVPSTGAAAYPQFDFIRNQQTNLFAGNQWILVVPVFPEGSTCQYLTYYPNQNYSGSEVLVVNRFGDWALIELSKETAKEDGLPLPNDWLTWNHN